MRNLIGVFLLFGCCACSDDFSLNEDFNSTEMEIFDDQLGNESVEKGNEEQITKIINKLLEHTLGKTLEHLQRTTSQTSRTLL